MEHSVKRETKEHQIKVSFEELCELAECETIPKSMAVVPREGFLFVSWTEEI